MFGIIVIIFRYLLLEAEEAALGQYVEHLVKPLCLEVDLRDRFGCLEADSSSSEMLTSS